MRLAFWRTRRTNLLPPRLMAPNPRLTDERLAELGHLFRDAPPRDVPDPAAVSDGLPDDYEPGHED